MLIGIINAIKDKIFFLIINALIPKTKDINTTGMHDTMAKPSRSFPNSYNIE